jgi:hypothetical protein
MRWTERTIRNQHQWCKITRDNLDRTYTFAYGREGEGRAYGIDLYPFKSIRNWSDAMDHALFLIRYN